MKRRRKIKFLFLALTIVMAMASILLADDVLRPGANNPKQVVLLRQFIMQAMSSNVGDLRNKVQAGDIKGVSVNAKSLAALASFLPILYSETHRNEYPIPGKKFFFRGAPPAEIGALAQNLLTQAKEIMKLSDSNEMATLKAQVPQLLSSCTACHKATRGEY